MSRAHQKSIYEALGRNSVHPFPARMAPGIALEVISKPKRPITVLDPMMGSGTVIALARANGHRAIGIDIDPLAVLISKAWTKSVNRTKTRSKAIQVLNRARENFRYLALSNAYPKNANKETRIFLRYWFDNYARRQLTALSKAIHSVRDERIKLILWCAFSRLIIAKQSGVSLAKDLAHSRPHKSFETAPIKPFSNFLVAVERVLENCIGRSSNERGPNPSIRIGDARRLKIQSGSIDLVLTSPPYLNAIDYMRCSKFSLVWMGYNTSDIRNLRAQSVGTEVGQYHQTPISSKLLTELRIASRLSGRDEAVLTRFIDDMNEALGEAFRVLLPGGKAMYVLGENTLQGTYIRNAKIVEKLAQQIGFVLRARKSRSLPPNRRYLPPPSKRNRIAALDARMRREVVLLFVKPKRKQRRKSR